MPVIESCILHRCNFEFLWQLRYDRWMARTRVIKSLLVGPRCILKHHESSRTNFHKKKRSTTKVQDHQENTHYSLLFLFHFCKKTTWPFTSFTKQNSSQIWPIPIPMGRAPPKSTPRNGIQRNLGKFRASWLGGGLSMPLIQPGMPSDMGEPPAWDCSCISSLVQLAGNKAGRKVATTVAPPRSNPMCFSCVSC